MADDLLVRVYVDFVGAEGALLVLPLRQGVLLLLARAVHGRVVAVVQRARVLRGRGALFGLSVVLDGVQQLVDGSGHGGGVGWAGASEVQFFLGVQMQQEIRMAAGRGTGSGSMVVCIARAHVVSGSRPAVRRRSGRACRSIQPRARGREI